MIGLLFGVAIGLRSRVKCRWVGVKSGLCLFVFTQSGVGSELAGLVAAAAHVIALSRSVVNCSLERTEG